jgi:hypothetical protein
LYVKVLFEPLDDFDVPVNVGWAPPLAAFMLMLTVPESAKPGSVGSLQVASVQSL